MSELRVRELALLPMLPLLPPRIERLPRLLDPLSEVGVVLRLLGALPLPCVLRLLDEEIRWGVKPRTLGTATTLVLILAGIRDVECCTGVVGPVLPGNENFLPSFWAGDFAVVTSLAPSDRLRDNDDGVVAAAVFATAAAAAEEEDKAVDRTVLGATGLRTALPLLLPGTVAAAGLLVWPEPKLILPRLGGAESGVVKALEGARLSFPVGER